MQRILFYLSFATNTPPPKKTVNYTNKHKLSTIVQLSESHTFPHGLFLMPSVQLWTVAPNFV